jgi:hypothetical protein
MFCICPPIKQALSNVGRDRAGTQCRLPLASRVENSAKCQQALFVCCTDKGNFGPDARERSDREWLLTAPKRTSILAPVKVRNGPEADSSERVDPGLSLRIARTSALTRKHNLRQNASSLFGLYVRTRCLSLA